MNKKKTGLSAGKLAMMALGSVIGGSFFLGSAVAINAAGPAIIISYILGGVLIYFILYALSEMTVANPDSGSFRTFAADAFGPGAGFVVGWVYWTGMVLAMSSEATAVSLLIKEWYPGISVPVVSALIIIAVTLLNLLGADKLSRLESALSLVKLSAIVFFIILAVLLITGLFPGRQSFSGAAAWGSFAPGGIRGIAGSMLIVIFTYAGFEVIGLAASESSDPHRTVPKAIYYTVISLVGLYILTFLVMLPLIPSVQLSENVSPMVAALTEQGMQWAGDVMRMVLVAAILSTMLAAMFGLGRMMRSLADERDAPGWLRDKQDVPYRGIIFSGFGMLAGLGLGLLLPRVYLFLISAGGFALLFTYASILAAHIRFRKKYGCPPEGKCQMPGYPYTSWLALISLLVVIISMPFIPGQTYGLIAGLAMLALYSGLYAMKRYANNTYKRIADVEFDYYKYRGRFSEEISEELIRGLQELDELEKYKDDEDGE
jgi:L-asparagine transporter-like permease